MAQNQNIGLLGQYLTVNSTANTSTFASGVVVGNSTVNVAINSSSVSISGTPIGSGSGTVTSVGSGNGLTGGPITASGSLSVLANSGIVANSTGLFVNAAYINSISANNAAYLGGTIASSYVTGTPWTSLGYTNNTGNYTISGVYTHTANLIVNTAPTGASFILNAPVVANGVSASGTQVLTSTDTGNVYWSTVTATVNVAAQYAWTNTQSFSNTITFNGALISTNTFSANGGVGSAGQVLTSGGSGANVYWSTVSGGGGGSFTNGASVAVSNLAYWNTASTAAAYTYYNTTTNSLDTVFV